MRIKSLAKHYSPRNFTVGLWTTGKLLSQGGGGGVHKHFFDRDARPRTNFNHPKK